MTRGLPVLDKSYRGRFPFRIATTSFIYPDHILPNLRALAPFLDEIEILLFEKDSPPPPGEIRDIRRLLEDSGLTVNVHLPLDIFLGSPDPVRRRTDAKITRALIQETLQWNPTAYCLHLNAEPGPIDRWRGQTAEGLSHILGPDLPPALIAVETLDYPFDRVEPLVADHGLSVCMDLGHMARHGYDPLPLFRRYSRRIPLMHLHAVSQGRDHLPLDRIEKPHASAFRSILGRFRGTVCVEVFSFDHLASSLAFLEKELPAPGKAATNPSLKAVP